MRSAKSLPSVLTLLLGVACGPRSVDIVEQPPAPVAAEITYGGGRDSADLLFVLTVGNSTATFRKLVGSSFPKLYEALTADSPTVTLDLHIGVTSTEVGAGPYQPPECVPRRGKLYVPSTDRSYLRRPSGEFITVRGNSNNISSGEHPSNVYEAFQAMAGVESGCSPFGNVHSLEASRAALSPDANPGFLRKDALLFVLYVADTMDCSLQNYDLFAPNTAGQGMDGTLGPYSSFRCFEFGFRCDINDRKVPGPRTGCEPVDGWLSPISRYSDFFRDLKPPGEVMLAAIAGAPEPVVVTMDPTNTPRLKVSEQCFEGGAEPELRIHRLLRQFPPILFTSKCTNATSFYANYDAFFTTLGKAIARRLQHLCLPAVPTGATDFSLSDAKSRCTVMQFQDGAKVAIPQCDYQPTGPCWSPASTEWCTTSAGKAITIERPRSSSSTTITCTW